MPSIRRSLIGYFLILLAVALAAIALLIDNFAHDTIRGRQDAETKRIQQEYDIHCEQAEAKFNEQLLAQGQALASEFRRSYFVLTNRSFDDFQKFRGITNIAVSSLTEPGLPSFTTQFLLNHPSVRNPLFGVVSTHLRMEDIRHVFESGGHPDLVQFHIPRWRQTIKLSRRGLEFPADIESHGLCDAKEYCYDDIHLAGVGAVRRVVLRTNLLSNRSPAFTPGPRTSRPPAGGERARPEARPEQPPVLPLEVLFPAVYVQTARPKDELAQHITHHSNYRDAQLASLEDETNRSLSRLRYRVMLISLLTFLAMALGGWLLVGRGLAPLRKLSEAAGQVSEKQFRLPIERQELTCELTPIHDRLTHSLDALRSAFEREKQAIADISHELRTPVAALLTTLGVALRKPRTAEQYRETIEECRGLTQQLAALVERIMTLAYLDAGQAPVNVRTADLTELAEGCTAMIRPLAAEQGITVVAKLEPHTELQTDPDKLREVMMNLLHNAVEYNRPGGRIELRLRREPSGGATLEVQDTGIGISSEVKHRIFERFFRADPSRTSTGVHAGLGLAIVKEYLTRIGGSIAVESELGAGSTFRVSLPSQG